MKTYPLRPRTIYPFGILRSHKDEVGNRPFDMVEGAKKEEDDSCCKCKYFHNDCPKPELSENIFIGFCSDYQENE